MGLDLPRIVHEALIQAFEAERLRHQVERGGDREGGDVAGFRIAAE